MLKVYKVGDKKILKKSCGSNLKDTASSKNGLWGRHNFLQKQVNLGLAYIEI
jgi:hypothetical protein